MSKRTSIALAVILGILLVDQLLKVWIKTSFEPGQIQEMLGSWFRLHYIENKGMAFGTQLGEGDWAKLALSIFRIIAVSGIAYYLYRIINEKQHLSYVIAIAMIWAGAFGNIIDSAFYDLIFNPVCAFDCQPYNIPNCYEHLDSMHGDFSCRTRGFLYGNVVDMFQFHVTWPGSNSQIFPAIFNFADASITLGVALIIVQYRKIFGKDKKKQEKETS